MLTKAQLFFIASLSTGLFVCFKMKEPSLPSVEPARRVFLAELFPQAKDLEQLQDADMGDGGRRFYIDEVNFPVGDELTHVRAGRLGYREDFSIRISGTFILQRPGSYVFSVSSDDGFSLHVDEILVCEHTANRPLADTQAIVHLLAGEHMIVLKYFQGYGPLGLVARYKEQGEADWHTLGATSGNLLFNPPD